MTSLLTGDLHLTDNPRDRYRLDFRKRLIAIGEARKIDTLYILGDLTEAYDNHGAGLTNEVVDYVADLAQRWRIVLLRGNHDASNPLQPFFGFLRHFPSVTYVNTPQELRDPVMGKVMCLPHTPRPREEWPDLVGYRTVLAHATFEGTIANGYQIPGGVPKALVPKGTRVISGDIHCPIQNGPVIHPGAPYTVDFGDDYVPRVLVVEPDKERGGKLVSIRCGGPQKRLIECVTIADLPSKADGIVQAGDIVKVRVHMTKAVKDKWHEFQADVQAWGEVAGVTIHRVEPAAAKEGMREKTRQQVRNAVSDTERVKAYGKHRKASDTVVQTGLKHVES